MDPVSRPDTPMSDKPLRFVRVARDAERRPIYQERSPCFRGSLSDEQYVQKQMALDQHATSRRRKSLWALVCDEAIDDVRASLEVYVYDIYFRISPDQPVELRQNACLSSLFVPLRHRGSGHARELLRYVAAVLRAGQSPSPLNEISVLVGSAKIGMENLCAISRMASLTFADAGVKWHDRHFASWNVQDAPEFAAIDGLLATEPIYNFDLDDLLPIACQRARDAVERSDSTGPVFTCVPDVSALRFKLSFYRMNWRYKRPTEDFPSVLGAKIGSGDDVSFCIWQYDTTITGVEICYLSSTSDQATLSLCAAATAEAQELSGCKVAGMLEVSPRVHRVLNPYGQPEGQRYNEGTLIVDGRTGDRAMDCRWIDMVRVSSILADACSQ